MSDEEKGIKKQKPKITILELVVILVIIVLLIALIKPRPDSSPRFFCGSQLFGLWKHLFVYSEENGKYPTPEKWCDQLVEFLELVEDRFICIGGKKARCHYAMNPNCEPDSPSDVVLLFETAGGWNQFGGVELLTFDNHEGEVCNILFNDGHVKAIGPRDVNDLNWGEIKGEENE
jgi:prepilin-type processing-associated H-X9-DG protein